MIRQGEIIKPTTERDLPDSEIKPRRTDNYYKVYECIKNNKCISPVDITRKTKIPPRTVTDQLLKLSIDGAIDKIECPCHQGILYKEKEM